MAKLERSDYETLVGAGVMAALALALWLASQGGKAAGSSDGYDVSARFSQVDGLTVGRPVHMSGIRIGTVTRIGLVPGTLKPDVTIGLRAGVAIPSDSAALIMSDGMLGGKFIRIEPGSDDAPMKPGASFGMVQDAVIVEQILEKIVVGAEARRRGQGKPGAPGKPPDRE